MYSVNFPEIGVVEFDLDHLEYDLNHNWANYPKGMISYIKEAGYQIDSGLDVLFYGNIPNGAGLSSSASIELVTGVMLKDFNLKVDRIDLVKLGQKWKTSLSVLTVESWINLQLEWVKKSRNFTGLSYIEIRICTN